MKPPVQHPQQMIQPGIPPNRPTNMAQMPQQQSSGQQAPSGQLASNPSGIPPPPNYARTSNFNPQGGPMQYSQEQGTRDLFTVPSDRVGLLIGKGGSKIREIQEVSGARMDIAKLSHPSSPEIRNVTLLGTKTQVTTARAMIDALVNESVSFRQGIRDCLFLIVGRSSR
jgi:hypothetical protein